MTRSFLIICSLFALCTNLIAQQNNFWYFGRKAALSFSAQAAIPIPRVLTNSGMDSDEGCGSISDNNGQLLFYTNGVVVFNKNHDTMSNGTGLAGNLSSCQSAIIVPKPGQDSLYYIFTTDAIENDFANGYRYSVVNMRRDNGRGEVIEKNTMLWPSCTERMAAARHANGYDVWLITNDNNSNVFRSWLITCNGIQASNVSSIQGAVLNNYRETNVGTIKISPDGTQLCQTHFPYFDETVQLPNFFQLFDFDNSTGIVSNPRAIATTDAQYTHCEYSPDSRMIYVTRWGTKKIDQFEAKLPTVADIVGSRVTINTTVNFFTLQLGPDEKIYVARPSFELAVINRPNVKGLGCNLQESQLNLGFGSVFLGLPSFINDIAVTNPNNGFTYTILDSCSGRVQFNGVSTMPGTLNWEWDFGDGNTSTIQNPIHTFNPSNQAYTVRVKTTSSLTCGNIVRSRLIMPSGIIGRAEFDYVKRCDSGYVRFVNLSAIETGPGVDITWDFGDGNTSSDLNPIHSYGAPGIYNVKLKYTNSIPCLSDSLVLQLNMETFTIVASGDRTILPGQTVQLYVTGPARIYSWTPSNSLNNPTLRNPVATPIETTNYIITARDRDNCMAMDSVLVTVLQPDDIYVPSAFTPGNDGRNDVLRPIYPAKYTLKNFSVFTRWGERIFHTSERGRGWNGKIGGIEQAAGVYVWMIRLIDDTGKTTERKGTSLLIR